MKEQYPGLKFVPCDPQDPDGLTKGLRLVVPIPLSGGNTQIATDNTCQSFSALRDFVGYNAKKSSNQIISINEVLKQLADLKNDINQYAKVINDLSPIIKPFNSNLSDKIKSSTAYWNRLFDECSEYEKYFSVLEKILPNDDPDTVWSNLKAIVKCLYKGQGIRLDVEFPHTEYAMIIASRNSFFVAPDSDLHPQLMVAFNEFDVVNPKRVHANKLIGDIFTGAQSIAKDFVMHSVGMTRFNTNNSAEARQPIDEFYILLQAYVFSFFCVAKIEIDSVQEIPLS